MKRTCHSEYGRLKSVFIKKPEQAFIGQANLDQQWKALNYLSKPDYATAVREYDAFEKYLQHSGTELFYFSEHEELV